MKNSSTKFTTNCIFCQIASKKLPSEIQYENGQIVAFSDIDPKAPIHILIVPKKHIPNVDELKEKDDGLIGQLILVARKIAREKKIDKSGYRLIFNQGSHAGQIMDHLHLHLLGGKPLGPMA